MTDELHDQSVMAASERLMELAEKADDQIAAQEREDRLWELGDWKLNGAELSPDVGTGDDRQ